MKTIAIPIVAFALVAAGAQCTHAQSTWKATPSMDINLPIPDLKMAVGMVQDAAMLSDGRVVVAVKLAVRDGDAPAPNELRFYDASGKQIAINSPTGSSLIPMHYVDQMDVMTGDSIVISAFGERARVLIDKSGNVVRNDRATALMGRRDLPIRSASGEGTLHTERALPTGDVVGYFGDFTEMKQFPLVYQYVMTLGDKSTHLIDLPAPPLKGIGFDGEHYRTFTVPAFGSRPMLTVGNERIFIANSSKPEIYAFKFDGTQLPTITLKRLAAPVTTAEAAAYKQRQIDRVKAMEQGPNASPASGLAQYIADLDSVPPAKTKPFFGDMVASATGDLWVSQYNSEPEAPVQWSVINTAGAETARVTLPAHFVPKRITSDRVLGLVQNGKDQHVVVLKLSKS